MIVPESFRACSTALPWAEGWAGDPRIRLQLLMADIEGARFAVRMQFEPGVQVFPHKHTGEVHAWTIAGEWFYLEYPESSRCTAGSYLFEPPGSTHTLKVADNAAGRTDVVFIIYGAMLHLDEAGNVVAVTDAESCLREYPDLLRQQGKAVPQVPTGGAMALRALT